MCKIIRNYFMERKLYSKVTQHYEIWTRVPQLVILEARPSYFEEAGSAASRKVTKFVGRTWKRKGRKKEKK